MEDDVRVRGLTLMRCDEWDEVDPSPLKAYYFKPWSMAYYSIYIEEGDVRVKKTHTSVDDVNGSGHASMEYEV